MHAYAHAYAHRWDRHRVSMYMAMHAHGHACTWPCMPMQARAGTCICRYTTINSLFQVCPSAASTDGVQGAGYRVQGTDGVQGTGYREGSQAHRRPHAPTARVQGTGDSPLAERPHLLAAVFSLHVNGRHGRLTRGMTARLALACEWRWSSRRRGQSGWPGAYR